MKKTDSQIIAAATLCLTGTECIGCPYRRKSRDPENATCDCTTEMQKDLLALVLRMKKQLKTLGKQQKNAPLQAGQSI